MLSILNHVCGRGAFSALLPSIEMAGLMHGADNAVSIAGDILYTSDEIRVVLGCKQMLDIRSISKPCNAVHVGTQVIAIDMYTH